MNTKTYVDSLFAGYEQTASLADFKEELQSNLDDKISGMVTRGMDEKAAFDKACAELGDVSALADEISLKKRQEVFEDMYLGLNKYMTPLRVALYVACGVVLAFGIIAALMTRLNGANPLDFFASLMPFTVLAGAGFTFLGLTQENAQQYPLSKKRAAFYTGSVAVILFGLTLFPMTYFAEGAGLMPALGTLIPFVLVGAAILTYLILTEKNRLKPWVKALQSEAVKHGYEVFSDPVTASRFGVIVAALWIFALAAFIILTVHIGIKLSWLAFLVALGVQMLVQAVFTKPNPTTR